MTKKGAVVAAILCLGAVLPSSGLHTGILPSACVARATLLVQARSGRICAPSRLSLRMGIDEAAARATAEELGKKREAALVEKRMAREGKERAARLQEREKDKRMVMGGGAAFVAGQVAQGGIVARADSASISSGLSKESVARNLEIIAQGSVPSKAVTKVAKSLKKNSGQMAVALEYKRAAGDTDDINHVDFRRYSVKLRESKLDVLLVDTSTAVGCDDCASFLQEQATAKGNGKGNFPGPVPIVSSGATSTLHIAEAKALGCQGALFSYGANGAELVKACLSLSLEPIAVVATEAEVAEAVAAGARILCTAPAGPEVSPADAAAQAKALKSKIPKDVVAVAGLDAQIGGPPSEVFSPEVEAAAIELGQVADKDVVGVNFSQLVLKHAVALRDVETQSSGAFSAIVAMRTVQTSGLRVERNYGTWMLEKLLSKKSTSFNIGEGTLGLS